MLTISIEDNAVKLTVFQGRRVKAAIAEPLDNGLVQDGVVLDKVKVGNVISGILTSHEIREKEAIACVSSVHSIYRVIYMPNIDKNLMAEAARREMERVSPVPLDTLYSSWQDIKISNVETALCLLGIPRDNIDSVSSTIAEAGLKLKLLELKPLSVARVATEGTATVIDVGEGGFDIVIKDRGIAELIRSLSFSSSSMTDKDKVAQIKDEAARTISYYNSSHPERLIGNETPCYLAGDLKDSLMQALEYFIKPMPAIITYPAGAEEEQYTANTGLASRSNNTVSKYLRVEMNVLPGVSAVGAAPAANLVPVIVFTICTVIVASTFFITQVLMRETVNLQAQVDERTKLVTQAQVQLKQGVDQLKQEQESSKAALNTFKAPLNYLAQQRSSINTELGKAISILPATIYLNNIVYDNVVIYIEGTAPNESMVMDYARELRFSGLYRLVMTTNVENRDYNEIFFRIALTLNR